MHCAYAMNPTETKPPTTASTSSSSSTTALVVQEHKHQQEGRTLEQQQLHHFKSILCKTLERFHQPTDNVKISIKTISSDDPVYYDASTQTFFIDPRITDKIFLPITAEKNMWTTVPPAYRFYAYMLVRNHIQTVRKGHEEHLDMLRTNLEYLLHHDRHYDAVLYAVIRSLTRVIRDKQNKDTSLPDPQEEYNAITQYLEKSHFILEQQIIKQPKNSMLVSLSLSVPITHKNGIKETRPLQDTSVTLQNTSPDDYKRIRQLLYPECRTHAQPINQNPSTEAPPTSTVCNTILATIKSWFSGLLG
jgi:hypothetical protein